MILLDSTDVLTIKERSSRKGAGIPQKERRETDSWVDRTGFQNTELEKWPPEQGLGGYW